MNEFVEQFSDLVRHRVKRRIARCPSASQHYQDLVSECQLKLIELSNDADTLLEKDSTRAFISRALDNVILDYIEMNLNPFRVPRYGAEGCKISTCEVREDDKIDTESINHLDADDFLLGLCRTDLEREVMQLRLQCYTNREIAARVGITVPHVGRIRQLIAARFEARRYARA